MRYVFTFEFLLFAVAMAGFALVGSNITGSSDWLDEILNFLRSS